MTATARSAAGRDRYASATWRTYAGQQLRLDAGTVRRFARAANVEELLVKATHRTGKLDGYIEHLHARLQDGVTDAITLHAELRHRGFTGSVQTVRRFLHPLRGTAPCPPPRVQ